MLGELSRSKAEKADFEDELEQMKANMRVRYFSIGTMDVISDTMFLFNDSE